MLAEHYLYINGNRASVKKWKHHQKINKDKSNPNTAKHIQGDGTFGEEDPEDILPSVAQATALLILASTPSTQSSQPSCCSARATRPP